jgi:L-idonate 5-dehydrogenase
MRAVVIHAAKDLRVEEREPEAAGPGEVDVAVEAGGICGTAASARSGCASR